ncbi:MAG: hypothetical protein WBD20_14460 [Pirellulaceae bacterium]
MKNAIALLFALVVLVGQSPRCCAIAFEKFGPESASKHPTVDQPRWPVHFIELVKHSSRVYAVEVNGSESLYFEAKANGFQELIDLFAQSRMRDYEVWIKPGPKNVQSLMKKRTFDFNVNVSMPSPFARTLDHSRGESERTYDPTLTIYVEPQQAEEIIKGIQFPPNFILHNEVSELEIDSPTKKPKRKPRHSIVMFSDGSPATQFEQDMESRVTLWEKGLDDGIALGIVSRTGYFQAPFSAEEIKRMTEGELWLTVTTGDWRTKASSDHPRIEPGKLGPSRDAASVVTIAKPQ